MRIEIDEQSGCCPGVLRAIKLAENYLDSHPSLYSLGSIVHNNTEISRLNSRGLVIIGHDDFLKLRNETVLIRAHGEPPVTYTQAHEQQLELIDCTCPVVLKIQQKIAKTYQQTREEKGQIIIFGKSGHAEVNGLVGQAGGDALVVESSDDIDTLISDGRLDLHNPVYIFSQTTKDPKDYQAICTHLTGLDASVTVFNTICKQVSSRHPHISSFAASHSIILFVSGKESSNGKILFNLCHNINPRTYIVENKEEISGALFSENDSVGICGATSTPRWQLEEIARHISSLYIT